MINTRLLRSDSGWKTVLFLSAGTLFGATLTWLLCWNVMASLMGVRAQSDYRAVGAAADAYAQVQILSHLRLQETALALQKAEMQLDMKTIEAASALQGTASPATLRTCNGLLGLMKVYRAAQPSQTEFKTQVAAALSGATIPPSFSAKRTKSGTTLYRFYRSRKK